MSRKLEIGDKVRVTGYYSDGNPDHPYDHSDIPHPIQEMIESEDVYTIKEIIEQDDEFTLYGVSGGSEFFNTELTLVKDKIENWKGVIDG